MRKISDPGLLRLLNEDEEENKRKKVTDPGILSILGGSDFDRWYAGVSKETGLSPDPYDPKHYYDYRAAYQAGVRGPDETGHWPSQFKLPGHPREIIDGINTRTGEAASPFDEIVGDPSSFYAGADRGQMGMGGPLAMPAKIAESFFRTGAGLTAGVSEIPEYALRKFQPPPLGVTTDVEDMTPGPPGSERIPFVHKQFDKAVDIWLNNADYFKDLAEKHGAGAVDEVIGGAIGGALPGVAEFMLGPLYAAGREAVAAEKRGEDETSALIRGGMKRYLLGQILHSTGELNLPLRTGALGTVGAVEGYSETGDVGEAAKSGAVLATMGLMPMPGSARPRLEGMGAGDVFRRWAEPAAPPAGGVPMAERAARDITREQMEQAVEGVGLDKMHFFSGVGVGADFRGAKEAGASLGVEFFSIGDAGIPRIQEASETNRIFVDNGAFTVFGKNRKEGLIGTDKEIKSDWDAVFDKYRKIVEGSKNPGNLYFVAPDVIGNAAETVADQSKYALRLSELQKMGVNIIVPLQKGMSIEQYRSHFADMNAILEGKAIAGLPSNKEAWRPEEVSNIVSALGAERVHLLGVAPNPSTYVAYTQAIRSVNPNVEVFSDAVPTGFKGGVVSKEIRKQIEKEQQWARVYDDTELFGVLKNFSEKGLEQVGETFGVDVYGITPKEFAKDASSEGGLDLDGKYSFIVDVNAGLALDKSIREVMIEDVASKENRGYLRASVTKDYIWNLLKEWKKKPIEAEQPEKTPKIPKGKKQPVRLWKGQLYIPVEDWRGQKINEMGLRPFFTTDPKKGVAADRKIMEMIDQGYLQEGATLDDLVEWIQNRRGKAGEAVREAGIGTVRGEDILEEKALVSDEKAARETVPESAIKPGDQFRIEGERFQAIKYDEDGYLVLQDGEEMRLAPDETIRIDGGEQGITRAGGQLTSEYLPPDLVSKANQKIVELRALAKQSETFDMSILPEWAQKSGYMPSEPLAAIMAADEIESRIEMYNERAARQAAGDKRVKDKRMAMDLEKLREAIEVDPSSLIRNARERDTVYFATPDAERETYDAIANKLGAIYLGHPSDKSRYFIDPVTDKPFNVKSDATEADVSAKLNQIRGSYPALPKVKQEEIRFKLMEERRAREESRNATYRRGLETGMQQPLSARPPGRFVVDGPNIIDVTTGNVVKSGRDDAALRKVAATLNAGDAERKQAAPVAPKTDVPEWINYNAVAGTPVYITPEGTHVVINWGSSAMKDADGEKVGAMYFRPRKTDVVPRMSRFKGIEFGTVEEVTAALKERAEKRGWKLLGESTGPDYEVIDQFAREEYDKALPTVEYTYEALEKAKLAVEKRIRVGYGTSYVDSIMREALGDRYPEGDTKWQRVGPPKAPPLPGITEGYRLTPPEPGKEISPEEERPEVAGAQGVMPGMQRTLEDMRKAKEGVKPPPGTPEESPLFKSVVETGKEAIPKPPVQPGLSTQPTVIAGDAGYQMPGSVNPEVQERMTAAEGIKDPSWLQRIKSAAISTKQVFTRAHQYLDRRRYAAVLDHLRQFDATVAVAKQYAYNSIRGITAGLGPEKTKLLTRGILIPDLLKDIESGMYSDRDELPWGYKNVDEIRVDEARWMQEIARLPDVQAALERRRRAVDVLTKELVANDLLDPGVLEDPRYYHKQILQYMNLPEEEFWRGGPYTGTSSTDVRLHRKGFQMARKGSIEDYNTRYIESEFEWMAQAVAQLRTKYFLNKIDRAENIIDQIKEAAQNRWGLEARDADGRLLWRKNWKTLIPEFEKRLGTKLRVWQPEPGNWFYVGRTISERILDKILVEGTMELQARGEDYMIYNVETGDMRPISKSLILGGRNREWVIPEDLARTMDSYRNFGDDNPLSRAAKVSMKRWKQYILLNPIRASKYLLNNTTGDLDITIAYDPAILKYVKWDKVKGLYNHFVRGGPATDWLLESQERDVIGSGITLAEIQDIGKDKMLRLLTGKKEGALMGYWRWVKDFNVFREAVLRQAAYEYFKERIGRGETHYGASDPAQIRTLMKTADTKDVAAKLSRELVGDYGDVSKGGQWLRSNMIPFYSWLEINAPRYYRLLRNAAVEGGPSTFGETFAKKGAGSLARFTVQALALYGAVNLWNYLMFPEENRKLNGQKGQLHLILRKDPDTGKVTSVRFQGALSDAFGWFGLESAGTDIQALRSGEMSPGEKLTEMAKAPAERIWMGIHPAKSVAETIVGYTTYPNLFSRSSWIPGSGARPIRSRGESLARLFSADIPYKYLTGRPTRGVGTDLLSLIAYQSDPGERSYQNIRSEAMDFLERRGRTKPSTTYTPKTLALYYYKQAVQMGDKRAEERWRNKYEAEGGTEEAAMRSVAAGHPMNWIPKDLRDEFVFSLTPRQQQDFQEAQKWWENLYGR